MSTAALKQKENIKLIKSLQSLLLSKREIDDKSLTSLGIDPKIKLQEFRNIKITYDSWNGLKVNIIDDKKDLDGNLISENKKLAARVKSLFENGTNKIKISELNELNIWNPSKEIIIGNLRLKNNSDFFYTWDYYEIQVIDVRKNIDGLWLDVAITPDKVLEILHKYDLPAKSLTPMKELDLNKELEMHFRNYFQTVKKGGRSNQGDIDLILGSNHNYGIELKLAKELTKASASQKAIGQIEQYTRQFKGNFMLIIAGVTSDKHDKSVSEVVRKAKECKCQYYYLEAH